MSDAKEEIIKLLKKEVKTKDIPIEVPANPDLGDFAVPCFAFSKQLKKNPAEIANDLANKLKPDGIIKEIKATGPYLNFFIDKQSLADEIITDILKNKNNYGKGKDKQKIMVEFVSPNTNKSLHLGHVRNGILGESVSKILEFNGNKVIRTSLNNDRGTGMSEAMLGYQLFHKGETPKVKPDHFVAQCYVDYKKSENDKTKQQVRELTKKWEDNDKETRALWKKLTTWIYKGYKETYKNLGIKFDKEYYESAIYTKGKEIVEDGIKKGIFEEDEGAVIAKLEKYKIPNKILIKSDGTSLYLTQDLYLAKLKFDDFKIDESIYVVASEQDNHFRQLFKILELLKFTKKLLHLSYGLVNLPEGRMKSREGTVVDADDLIEEVIDLAKKEIKQRHKDLKEAEINKRAKIIGLGALKFFMVKFDNVTSFTYNPKESLSFEGETGPYVQYAHARICSILRKTKLPSKANFELLTSKEEKALITILSNFTKTIEQSAKNYKPHLIARYLLDLSQAFNEFYHAQNILQADKDVKAARLLLIAAVKQILKNGLTLLGIDSPERM